MPVETVAAAAAAISAITAAGGAIASNTNSKRIAKWQNKWNREYMAIQQEYSKELMDYQYNLNLEIADYNSPQHQRERMLAAGLNPNFSDSIDSSASAAGNVGLGSAPSGQAPDLASIEQAESAKMNAYSNSGAGIIDAALKLAQTKNIDADTDSKNITNKYLDDLMKGSVDMQNVQILFTQENTKLTKRQSSQLVAQTYQTQISTQLLQQDLKMVQDKWNLLKKNVEIASQEYENLKVDYNNKLREGNLLDAEAIAQIENSETVRQLRPFQVRYLQEDIKNKSADTQLKFWQSFVAKSEVAYNQAKTASEKILSKYYYWQGVEQMYKAQSSPEMIRATIESIYANTNLTKEQKESQVKTTELITQQALSYALNNEASQFTVTINGHDIPLNILNGEVRVLADFNQAVLSRSLSKQADKVTDWIDVKNTMETLNQSIDAANKTLKSIKDIRDLTTGMGIFGNPSEGASFLESIGLF